MVCTPTPGEDAPDRGNGIVTGGGTVDEERPILQGESALRDCLDSVARAPRAIAAVTKETPRPVLDEADVRVAATGGVHEVLRRLLAAAAG